MNFQEAKFVTSYGLTSQLPKSERLEIAFGGRSNVGKSSMLNKLFQRKALARVSSMPGKTATINFYRVGEVDFVDLPGYGYAKVSKTEQQRWSKLIEHYFQDDRRFALIVSLVDMRHPPSKLDIDMIHFLLDHEFPFIVVLTKADKLNKTERAKRLAAIRKELPYGEDLTIIPFSAQTGEGVDTLREIFVDICREDEEDEQEENEQEEVTAE